MKTAEPSEDHTYHPEPCVCGSYHPENRRLWPVASRYADCRVARLIRESRREGAEEMRERCAAEILDDALAEIILALPLPGDVEAETPTG